MYSIITMIKLILIAFLSLALSGPVYGHDDESADCYPGNARIKLSISVPAGACGCDSDEEEGEKEDLCLGLENSKKISDAVLNVLELNDHSYDVIDKLLIHRFVYGLEYNDFSDNIKNNDFEFEGFAELKELVEKYKVCKKECKVYFTLRKALRENAADTNMAEVNNEGEDTQSITLEGKIVILGDSVKELQEKIVTNNKVTKVVIKTKTFIGDVNLFNAIWHGKHIRVEAENFIAASKNTFWDVSACMYQCSILLNFLTFFLFFTVGDEESGSITIAGVKNWDFGPNGDNKFETTPEYIVEE